MNRLLTATAATLLMAASPLAFADTSANGSPSPSATAPITSAVPDQGTSNPSAVPVNGNTATDPATVGTNTAQQNVTPPAVRDESGQKGQEPKKIGAADADQAQPADNAAPSDSTAAPMHRHRIHHVRARSSSEVDVTKALNVLSANGYTNAQDVQAMRGHKVSAKASKNGQDVNVVVDPSAGTVAPQQNS